MKLLPKITFKTCLNIVFLCNTYIRLSRQIKKIAKHLSSDLMSLCNGCVVWSYCNNLKCLPHFFFLLWLRFKFLILPLVQPFVWISSFQNATFSASIVFWSCKGGEEDPLSFYKVRDDASPLLKVLFQRFTFQSGLWYIQASHGPVLQWSSKDKCCQSLEMFAVGLSSLGLSITVTLVRHVGTMGQWTRWVIEGNASG